MKETKHISFNNIINKKFVLIIDYDNDINFNNILFYKDLSSNNIIYLYKSENKYVLEVNIKKQYIIFQEINLLIKFINSIKNKIMRLFIKTCNNINLFDFLLNESYTFIDNKIPTNSNIINKINFFYEENEAIDKNEDNYYYISKYPTYDISNNIIYCTKFWDYFILQNEISNTEEINCDNLVLITSKIYVSDVSFDYINKRSIYTKEERLQQTLNTIDSIRKYIPNNYIVLVDNSIFKINEIHQISSKVDKFINIINDSKVNTMTDNSEIKAYGEIAQTKQALDFIDKSKFNNFFKISGRYLVNETFNINNYLIDNNVFKKEIIGKINKEMHKHLYLTFLYKICPSKFKKYVKTINDLFEVKGLTEPYEFILPKYLKYDFTLINNLGMTKNVSVWKDFRKM